MDTQTFIHLLTDKAQTLTTGKLIGPIRFKEGERVPSSIPLFTGKIEAIMM
jgi:hypothetical protein